MSDCAHKETYKNSQKRIVDYSRPVELKKNYFQINVQYIIDTGNLIQDVRVRYDEVISFIDKDLDYVCAILQRYSRAIQKTYHALELELREYGATRFNAKKTATLLLKNYSLGCTK